MEIGLLENGLNFTRTKKKWIVLVGFIGFSSYGAYKMYNAPKVARARKRITNILGALVPLAEMVSDSAETVTIISRDLKEFLKSDSDEIPSSLRQLSKIARSQEFSESVTRVSKALTVGILRGYKVESTCSGIQEMDKSNLHDRIMDKLMSNVGTGFVSVIVGSFARNLVLGFYSSSGYGEGFSEHCPSVKSASTTSSRWLDLLLDDKGRVLVADCIKNFVGTAVAVYLDKTMHVNLYDDIFSGLTNPKHQNDMKDIMVSLCNGMVETLVKTSHRVLTASKSGSSCGSSDDSCSTVDHDVSSLRSRKVFESEPGLGEVKEEMDGSFHVQKSGWITSVSSTLAVPSNRKFVLDVTGRVTFEAARSVVEIFSCRIMECLKRSVDVVRADAVERGFEVVRYFGSKSSVILTLCLMFFLHIVENTRILVPS